MSDYSKVYNGAAKDAAQSTIIGTDFDTEFAAIETAIATKANKKAPAAAGNVATLSSSGDLQDSGVTSTELSILDGATVTTAELNKLDGVTATTAELNILDGVTATATEINLLDGLTGTVWTSTNDGGGSGLNADLLDGNHASAFVSLSGNNTFTGTNTFNNTATFATTARSTLTNQNVAGYFGKYNGNTATTVKVPSGWTISRISTGVYRVTHNLNLNAPTTNCCVVATGSATANFVSAPDAANTANYFTLYSTTTGGPADDIITFRCDIDLADVNYP